MAVLSSTYLSALAREKEAAATPSKRDWPLYVLLLYLAFEYLRPIDLIWLRFLGKLRPGLVLSSLVAVVWLFSSRKGRSFSSTTKWLIVYLVLLTAYIPFVVNNQNALYAAKDMFLVTVCFLGITAWIDSPAKLHKAHLWIVWTALCLSFRGILRFRGYTKNVDQFSLFLGDENDFCLLMVVLLPFVYLPLFGKYSKKTKLLCLAASFLCMIAIVVSDSRGGFIGLVLVGFYCWAKSPRKIPSLILVGLLAVILLVAGGKQYRKEIASIGKAGEKGDTGRIRLISWRAGWMVFLDHPFGVGGNNYRFSVDAYTGYFNSELNRSLAGRQAHSIYFTALPELGVFGLVILPGLFLSIIRKYRKTEKNLRHIEEPEANRMRIFALAGLGGLLGYLSAGAFVSVLYYPHAYYLGAFAVVASRLTDEMIASKSKEGNSVSS